MNIATWFSNITTNYSWIMQVIVVLAVTTLIYFVETIVYRSIVKHFEKTKRIWDDLLLHTLHPPFIFLVWLIGLTEVANIIKIASPAFKILNLTSMIRQIGIIIFVVWVIMRFIKQIGERLVHPAYCKRPLDKTTVDLITKLLVLSVAIVALLGVLQQFNVRISAILALFGGGAIVLGFGAQSLLTNFFGALMVYMDRPFSVGDWISSPDKDIEGTVEQIGWRSTRIRTFDKRPLYVPNAIFSTVAIQNPSRMTNRRIKTTVGVRFQDAPKIAAIVADIDAMLHNHPDIDTRQTCFVRLNEFGENSLNILVYTFTKTTEWVKFQAVQEDVFLKIIDIIYNKHSAAMAFPTRTLELPATLINKMKG
ncbi:MAG: hypothetical protein A3C55_02875 [Gammaproteobacteria bacterium RIFCSPHIGHO2_02_FULL_42_13]|nr:MAG: hypothetical protein A3C55_02875 [Gammaproteobacteria bacterium RIFCSPHIGHO2_02_FULL_42_13]OGT68166.1 MAG: hypothetical protein A3H43_02510 [Gammaproteobacteria bacterium RIFCSPLOWO2_02_FULL_42_9]